MALVQTHSTVIRVIALLRDGGRGFRKLGEKIKDAECREFLLQEAGRRDSYADELERESNEVTGEELHPSHTKLGTVHRGWVDVKAVLGAGDYSLLQATELCEWFAVKAYSEAVRDPEVPASVRDLMADQARAVHQSREVVAEFRRTTAGRS